jgi:hypothetical protein
LPRRWRGELVYGGWFIVFRSVLTPVRMIILIVLKIDFRRSTMSERVVDDSLYSSSRLLHAQATNVLLLFSPI